MKDAGVDFYNRDGTEKDRQIGVYRLQRQDGRLEEDGEDRKD